MLAALKFWPELPPKIRGRALLFPSYVWRCPGWKVRKCDLSVSESERGSAVPSRISIYPGFAGKTKKYHTHTHNTTTNPLTLTPNTHNTHTQCRTPTYRTQPILLLAHTMRERAIAPYIPHQVLGAARGQRWACEHR